MIWFTFTYLNIINPTRTEIFYFLKKKPTNSILKKISKIKNKTKYTDAILDLDQKTSGSNRCTVLFYENKC